MDIYYWGGKRGGKNWSLKIYPPKVAIFGKKLAVFGFWDLVTLADSLMLVDELKIRIRIFQVWIWCIYLFGLFSSFLIWFFFHSLCKFSPLLVVLITQDFTTVNDFLLFLFDVWCNLLTSFEVASVTQEFNCHCCPSNGHSVSRL